MEPIEGRFGESAETGSIEGRSHLEVLGVVDRGAVIAAYNRALLRGDRDQAAESA